MTFGEKVIDFYASLQTPVKLPLGVEVLYPFKRPEVKQLISKFNNLYFHDENQRTFLIGINPGRLGGGITGIPFTDPIRLETHLGISNSFDKKQELSSSFIYQMIGALGGPRFFYRNFYFTSVSPVGFIKNGRNINYYDLPELQRQLEEYIVAHLKQQVAFGAKPIAFSLGQGKNMAYLHQLNKKHHLFEHIAPLPHPRWVMQYRLKRLEEFITLYKETLLS